MDKEANPKPCPFPRPIKSEVANENENVNDVGHSWQAKESFPKLRLVRVAKQKRSNVVRKRGVSNKRISEPPSSSVRYMDKMYAKEIRYVEELRATFQNNIDRINADWEMKVTRINADWETKLTQKMIAMEEELRRAKMKKWCPVCLQEVTIVNDFEPSACSIRCWEILLKSDGYWDDQPSSSATRSPSKSVNKSSSKKPGQNHLSSTKSRSAANQKTQ